MATRRERQTASANPEARVVDLAAYRAARRPERDQLPLLEGLEPTHSFRPTRVLSITEIAHRRRMLVHLTGTS